MNDRTPIIRPNGHNLPTQHMPMAAAGYDEYPSEVPLRENLNVLFKYRLLIMACAGLFIVLSLIYAFTATPLYTAQSKIRISSYEPILAGANVETLMQQKSQEANYLETQIQEIKSYSIADKVLEDEYIRADFEREESGGIFSSTDFKEKRRDPKSAMKDIDAVSGYNTPIVLIKSYLDSLTISPIRRTSLVKINATVKDAELAARIANRHALSYIDWIRELRVNQQARGLEFLSQQADELRQKVADYEREIADYAEENSIVAVNKDENITAQRMSQLNELLTAATASRIEAERRYDEAAERKNSAGFDDNTTQDTRTELARLEAEYSLLSEKFMPEYPKMKQLKSQIEQMKSSVAGQRGEILIGLKVKAEAARENEEELNEELEQQKSKAFELSKKQVQYNILTRELNSSRELLQNVVRQAKETSLAVESNTTNVSIVDYAVAPDRPSYPRKKIILLIGLFLGFAVGVILAFLLHYLDNSIRTPEDVQKILRLPSLGVVPSFESETKLIESAKFGDMSMPGGAGAPKPGSDQEIASNVLPVVQDSSANTDASLPTVMFTDNPHSLAAEAYRTIRTGILLSQAGEPPRTILVTSSQSSEGKTTSSVNLAASLASAGARVVLIDADLRRPSVYSHFNLDLKYPGIVEVITGQMTLDEVYLNDVMKRVTVVPGGSIPPNPAELLGSLEMAMLIDQLSEEFDYVVIDSPPVLPVTDAVILSRYVDGVVVVVKGGETPKRVVNDALSRLRGVGARMLGVVLNDIDVTGGDYYYYNRYYHSYYHREAPADDTSVAKG